VGVAALCAAVSAVPHAIAADPVRIDVILPLTGGVAFLGKGEQQALQLLQKSVNRNGGIQGRDLEFVFYDDQSSPQNGVVLSNQVIAKKPTVVIGSAISAICNAMSPLFVNNGPVMYCLSPVHNPPAGSYVFVGHAPGIDLVRALLRYARMNGWTNVATLTTTDATGQDAERQIAEVLTAPENTSIKIVARERMNPTDVSATAQVEKIKAAKPQILLVWCTSATMATAFKSIVQAGLEIPIGVNDGNMTFEQMKRYADFLPKQLYIPTSLWAGHGRDLGFASGVEKALNDFYGEFKAAGLAPDGTSALAWGPAMVVVDAIRNLVSVKGYAGISGEHDFTKAPQRGLGPNDAVVTRWDPARGTWVPVSKRGGEPVK
jgi:branched-chain amino acid transport system substrate-binding protein